jgi:hypothetical protein
MQRISTAENDGVLRPDFGVLFARVNASSHYFFPASGPGLSQLAMLTEMESKLPGFPASAIPSVR